MSSYSRETNCSHYDINWRHLFAQGSFKDVYKGKFLNGPRSNQPCVAKLFRDSSEDGTDYFNNEMRVVNKALELVWRFNQLNHIPLYVYVNVPTIANTTRSYFGKALLEPFIRNFEKLNSISGWAADDGSVMDKISQALSHFTYHSTRGQFVLCDIQGGRFNKGFAITDPVIMSHRPGTYGPTDLGRNGIITFFAYHDCNEYCLEDWHRPKYRRPILDVKRGTSMIYRPAPQTSRYGHSIGRIGIAIAHYPSSSSSDYF